MTFFKKENTKMIFIMLIIIGVVLILFNNTIGIFIADKIYFNAMSGVENTPGVIMTPNYDLFTIKIVVFGAIFAIWGGVGLIIEGIILKYKNV
ncbi:hypothetical protein LGK97_16425 [Clostridium sp. CS001]|uniref:hypothetical protein n=1 Tax=Clostridium sp. CS001 TaxID=2880648 RepID=UPI001CF10E1E|nr:hypothetical protein [Clostridium sp. CS001]MCB2291314.1 hypothetical protein [Clostridium sp. CS001]